MTRPSEPTFVVAAQAGAKKSVSDVLVRALPVGGYHTGHLLYVLAIAEQPGGRPLNRANGTFGGIGSGRHRLYRHFCRDGRDQPDSVYRLLLNNAEVEVQPIGGR